MPDEYKREKYNARDIAILSMFLAFALVLGYVERLIPIDFIVPGVRLGLANVMVLSCLYLFSVKEAFMLAVLKCAAAFFFMGSGVAFIYSLTGSVLSLFFMALAIRLFGRQISSVGVSVIGAVFHNIGQLSAAVCVMRTFMVLAYLPMLLLAGVLTGIVVGILVKYVVGSVKRIENRK